MNLEAAAVVVATQAAVAAAVADLAYAVIPYAKPFFRFFTGTIFLNARSNALLC